MTEKCKPFSREAKYYALKELARRAGVTEDFFRSWSIEFGAEYVTVWVASGSKKCIRFKSSPLNSKSKFTTRRFYTSRAFWMLPPREEIKASIPDFIIPFTLEKRDEQRPLFSPVGLDCVMCHFDLLASTLFSLARFEETIAPERDKHDRFPAAASIAFRDGFLNRPIVDEYGLALEQVLLYLLPSWKPIERQLRVKLSHDIDNVGLPFNLITTIGHTIRRRRPSATIRDFFSLTLGIPPTYLNLVKKVVQPALDRGLDSATYWKTSPLGPYDTGYNPRHPKIRKAIDWLREQNVEIGIHPGYDTYLAPEKLKQETEILREVLGESAFGGRQHYLRWSPESWVQWESCGLAYDSSLGYFDHIGFRAGTCIPYRPWLFSLNREAQLLEIPLIISDMTLAYYMRLTVRQSQEISLEHLTKCQLVGGTFTLLWHNTSVIDPIYGNLYENILDTLSGCKRFDWKTQLQSF